MGIFKEFQDFALKGNVVDMAVGIVIGGAFGTIVKSLVDDIIMPPVGLAIGGIDFSELVVTLKPATEDAAAVTINYGNFINAVIAFLIVAWALFMVIKGMNKARESFEKKEEAAAAAPAVPPADVQLLTEIRDLLKAKG
ncbi:MAG: large-conductance mechanosensitive channel protein MscL [Caulobacterales bacterium]|nr:large-conductance mechanosensitive channel protein MscL [Caulobacterales bacterium]HRX40041.1 large-conductance mechanosensitive channel protein MscL [Parvularculaceae bacterium]